MSVQGNPSYVGIYSRKLNKPFDEMAIAHTQALVCLNVRFTSLALHTCCKALTRETSRTDDTILYHNDLDPTATRSLLSRNSMKLSGERESLLTCVIIPAHFLIYSV